MHPEKTLNTITESKLKAKMRLAQNMNMLKQIENKINIYTENTDLLNENTINDIN